jgi:hypothetical protein
VKKKTGWAAGETLTPESSRALGSVILLLAVVFGLDALWDLIKWAVANV